jgi:hypothetical protein
MRPLRRSRLAGSRLADRRWTRGQVEPVRFPNHRILGDSETAADLCRRVSFCPKRRELLDRRFVPFEIRRCGLHNVSYVGGMCDSRLRSWRTESVECRSVRSRWRATRAGRRRSFFDLIEGARLPSGMIGQLHSGRFEQSRGSRNPISPGYRPGKLERPGMPRWQFHRSPTVGPGAEEYPSMKRRSSCSVFEGHR